MRLAVLIYNSANALLSARCQQGILFFTGQMIKNKLFAKL